MNKKLGFTLIELLVVIAIIGLLASIALVALSQARIKSRITKRKADVRQFRAALEFYYADNQSTYPHPGTPNNESDIQTLSGLISPQYLSFIANDPKANGENYQYVWKNNGKDYGLYIPFRNDGGTSCQFITTGGSTNWFNKAPICDYQ